MLHNTGSYGPNDDPINMGAPLNITPMSGQSIAHSLSNLSKMSQQTSQPPSGHYNLPEYSNYNQPPSNIGAQLNPFQNYQQLGYQPSFMGQNPQDTWHSSMLPVSLNLHNTPPNNGVANMLSGSVTNDYKDMVSQKNIPLNIPHVHRKIFQRDMTSYNDYTQNNIARRNNLAMLTKENSTIDIDRRRSLENTVKLIENILINSTTKNKSTEVLNEIESDPLLLSPKNETDSNLNDSNEIINVHMASDNDSSEPEDVKPLEIMDKLILEDMTTGKVSNVVVKVEETSWTDVEYVQPYDKDVNGEMRENVTDCHIVDSDTSINDALDIIKKGLKTDLNKYFECPYCSLVFKHPKRLIIHAKWHSISLTSDKKNEQAKEKELKRNQKKEAKELERLNAKEVKQPDCPQKYPCKDCEKIFNVKSSLKNHRQKFHPTRVRECKICMKQVFGWMALRAHVASHSGDGTSTGGYQCKDCPKQFKYAQSLAKHRDTHLEKTHECAHCPKKFGSQALVKMHMKTHERAQRGATYRCTYCAKGFFESYNLQVHERTHRNERPFSCEICNTSFGTNSSLKRHLKVSHSTSKPFACPVCRRSFVTESIRDRHQLRAHGDPEDFKFICEQCPCRYLKLKDLQKHIYKLHPTGKRRKKVKSDSE